MDNRNTTAPPHPSVYYPATNMGPPPSVSPIRRVAHSSQPSPVLDPHSYPQSNWRMVTPPNANAQSSSAFVSPTKGATHRLQPPTGDPTSIYLPVVQGQSNTPPHNSAHPDYSATRMGPPTDWGTVYPSHPLPEHSMAVDHPSAVNDRGYYRGYYSRVPTPHSQTTITPPRVHPRHSPHPSPQAHAETFVAQPRQISNLPPPRNTSSVVGYLGDIPANQLPHQHGIASPTRQRESNRVDVGPVRGPTKRGYNDIEDEEGHGNEHEEMDDIVNLNIRFMPRLTHSLTSAELSSVLDKEENQSHQRGLRTREVQGRSC